jgi:fumarate reductase subunit D
MRSTTSASTGGRARRTSARTRRASDSPVVHGLARAGLTARGIIYLLIGLVAILVAVGHSTQQADQQGALQLLAGKPYGLVALVLLGIGFAGYALWRLSEAVFGVTGDKPGAGPRLRSLARAVVYAFFAFLTFEVIAGRATGTETQKQQDITAKVMQHAGGRWLVGIVGLIVVICGLVLVLEGIKRKFMKYLHTAQMSRRTRRVIEILGEIGTVARGLVFALAGVLVIDAAVTHDAGKSGGIDKALLTLRDQPFGQFLLAVAALGLIIFGIYGLCEARWRKV